MKIYSSHTERNALKGRGNNGGIISEQHIKASAKGWGKENPQRPRREECVFFLIVCSCVSQTTQQRAFMAP